MDDKETKSFPSPPKQMTDACESYTKDQFSILDFIGFIYKMALGIDEVVKISVGALYKEENNKKFKTEIKKIENKGATAELRQNRRTLLEMSHCRSVDNYLNYISSILILIFKAKPETMKSNESVKLDFILNFKSIDEMISELVEKKVNELSYLGIKNLQKHLFDRLGFLLFSNDLILRNIIRIIETRNLIVRNKGRVNQIFLDRVENSSYSIGDTIKLEVNSIFEDIFSMAESVFEIEYKAVKKYDLNNSIKWDYRDLSN